MKQKTSLCFLSEEILDLAVRNRLMGYQKIDQPWKWPKETHWIYTTSASHWPHLMKSITARQDNEFFILLQSCFLKLFEKQANFVEQFQKNYILKSFLPTSSQSWKLLGTIQPPQKEIHTQWRPSQLTFQKT